MYYSHKNVAPARRKSVFGSQSWALAQQSVAFDAGAHSWPSKTHNHIINQPIITSHTVEAVVVVVAAAAVDEVGVDM